MKKRLVRIFMLISVLAMLGIAAAPFEARSIRLLESRFVPGKGVVFLFETTGTYTNSELASAFSYGGGQSLDVYCKVKNGANQISCMVKLVNEYANQEIMVSLVGQGFWVNVPERSEEEEQCIPVVDVVYNPQVGGVQTIAYKNFQIIVDSCGNPIDPLSFQEKPFAVTFFG
jgi:hypothetical protein